MQNEVKGKERENITSLENLDVIPMRQSTSTHFTSALRMPLPSRNKVDPETDDF